MQVARFRSSGLWPFCSATFIADCTSARRAAICATLEARRRICIASQLWAWSRGGRVGHRNPDGRLLEKECKFS